MLERARQIIREVLANANCPAILWSAGKDSQLLLRLVHDENDQIPVVWFRPQNTQFAKRMILEMNLEAWSWEPSDVYVLPSDDGLSLVREQAFGEHRFPVLLDVEDGDKCIADVFTERTMQLYPHFTDLFLGYKDTDYHPVLGSDFCPPSGWALGKAKVWTPLRHLNDEQVWAAIKDLGVPYDEKRYDENGADPDSVSCCTRCLQGERVYCPKEQAMIDGIVWDRAASLAAFKDRFALGGTK